MCVFGSGHLISYFFLRPGDFNFMMNKRCPLSRVLLILIVKYLGIFSTLF